MKLNEGENHFFHVISIVNIVEEGDFYLLRHNTGRRILVPVKPYLKYNIKTGQQLNCRVDKVNCTGKVFLEPKHPVYEEGRNYPFKIVSIHQENTNNQYFLISDCFNNQIRVPFIGHNNKIEGEEIILKVDRIKKGIPIFLPLSLNIHCQKPLTSIIKDKLPFIVIGVSQDSFGEDIFLLESEEGYRSNVSVKHFEVYGIKVGKTVLCEISRINQDGSLGVEPVNPFYKINEEYVFKITDNQTYDDNDETTVVSVSDDHGIKSSFNILTTTHTSNKNKTHVKCRVIGFRKGRPKLELCKFL